MRQPVLTFGMYGRRLGLTPLEDDADDDSDAFLSAVLAAILTAFVYCFLDGWIVPWPSVALIMRAPDRAVSFVSASPLMNVIEQVGALVHPGKRTSCKLTSVGLQEVGYCTVAPRAKYGIRKERSEKRGMLGTR